MHEVPAHLEVELNEVCEAVLELRSNGQNLRLRDDLKIRICRLWESGVSLSKIRKKSGVQSSTVYCWAKNFNITAKQRSFRVLTVLNADAPDYKEQGKSTSRELVSSEKPLVFRYAQGHAVLEIPASQLTPELMRLLTLC